MKKKKTQQPKNNKPEPTREDIELLELLGDDAEKVLGGGTKSNLRF